MEIVLGQCIKFLVAQLIQMRDIGLQAGEEKPTIRRYLLPGPIVLALDSIPEILAPGMKDHPKQFAKPTIVMQVLLNFPAADLPQRVQ